ncbi:secreted RxLR effector protein 161-like [Phragmites australis]|uniref:secreted RxLR effector protein 161-like n=1 Tax=Phragmites australis TaxID=29695 RepID=UPI002D77475F|nr:secreted RxLR effector protein 161-like [Phragmites australis]
MGYVSRYMEDPCEDHYTAVKHLLRHVVGTHGYGVVYKKEGGVALTLTGYSNSDMADDLDGCKSTTSVLFLLGHSPISWQSQKQRVVALSTCKAEYIVVATVACQGVWLARLLRKLTNEELQALTLMVDNKSAISLIKNPALHDRSKHIDTRYHFIRDCVARGQIDPEFVESEWQLTDILTKPLGHVQF